MARKNSLKRILCALCLFLSLLGRTFLALAEISNIQWNVLETKHTIVQYQSSSDLRKLNQKVDFSPGSWGLQGLFAKPSPHELRSQTKRMLDALYERVQEILDMRKRMKPVVIRVYSTKQQLHAAYDDVYGKRCQLRAWYIYETNTIYVTVEDLHEGILAHEMAHAVIDHYLLVRPPPATTEILARYVDSHLFE
jgi:hypothetical protein